MADAVLSAAADQIFALLKEQTVYHVNLVRGAEKEVRKLGQELNTIRNVLEDAENRRFQDKSINTWLWKLRQTSYEMEDILDEWKYALLKLHNGEHSPVDDDDAAPPKQKVCSFIPSSSCLCFKKVVARHEITKKILNVKARLDEILEEAKKYGFKIYDPTAYPSPEFVRDQSTFFINTEEVQGRGRDGDTLVDKLMGNGGSQEESGIQVLSIVGVGGLGKTTLAQLVYNHSRVKGSFDQRIWICVSDPFDPAVIAKGILESIGEREFSRRDWEFLKNCLKCGGAGSKILVTTRSERVARTMGKNEIFRPGLLSNDDCWLVLCCTARLERNEVEIFVDIGKKIVEKCSGLPLAATTLGGILCFKRSLREWEKVLNDEIWEMQEAEDVIFRPLLMSYKELSPTQKQCFSYCATFPKGYKIVVKRLIGIWMALGYLGSNSDDMELKGKDCIDVIAMRSLFQDFQKNDVWGIESCKMHDIVHDFAQYLRKSGRKEAGGVEVAAEMNKRDSPPNLCNRFVRLSVLSFVRCRMQGVPHEMDKLIHLRCLEEIPNEIGNLSHLRHLNLSINRLKELPTEIGNLKQLRHLNLDDNDDLNELPSEIWKLSFLQTFMLPGFAIIQIPEALGQITGLILIFTDEMGEEGSSRMDIIYVLKPHPNLRMLSIWDYKGSKLPLWIVSPANQLRKVELHDCDLTSLPSFGNLPWLEELSLEGMMALEFVGREFLGITTNTNFVAFPKLKELKFSECFKWEEWEDITAEEEESPAFQEQRGYRLEIHISK
ncbi:hypothetical protein ACS0TY_022623 [Phlomoides rotata]